MVISCDSENITLIIPFEYCNNHYHNIDKHITCFHYYLLLKTEPYLNVA